MACGTTNAVPLRDAVRKTGASALPALKEAIAQTNRMSFETLGLLRALTTELSGQIQGAVARGTTNEATPSGIMDGDIVIREADTVVHTAEDMGLSETLFGRRNAFHRSVSNEIWQLLVRRPDGTDAATHVTFDRETKPRWVCPTCRKTIITLDRTFPFLFTTFPDSVHRYWVHGAVGPWDKLVAEALWKGDLGGHLQTRELLEEAFARGCRDPLSFAKWLDALNDSGGFDTVPFLCASYEQQLARTEDAEVLALGQIAAAKSRAQFLLDQTEMAFRIADESIAKARSRGATDAVVVLLPWRVTLATARDPKEALAYARTNAAELRRLMSPLTIQGRTALRYAVRRLLAAGQPEMAHEMLGLFDPPSVRGIQSEVDAHRKLATQHSNETAAVYWMPIKAATAVTTLRAPPHSSPGFNPMQSVPNLSLRGPFRLDWTMRLPDRLSGGEPDYERTARVFAYSTRSITVDFDRNGCVEVSIEEYGQDLYRESAIVGNPRQRHRFSLQLTLHSLRLDVDGRPLIFDYFADEVDPLLAGSDPFAEQFAAFGDLTDAQKRLVPKFVTTSFTGSFERVVAYVPSTEKVDSDTMASVLLNMEQAIAGNDLTAVTQTWHSLQVAFRPVAGSKLMFEDVQKRIASLTNTAAQSWVPFSKVMEGGLCDVQQLIASMTNTTSRPLAPSGKAMGGRLYIDSGSWSRDGEWFTVSGTDPASGGGAVKGTLRVDNMEIAGVIDIPREATNASCFIHWNSVWAKDDNAFHITPGAGRFDFGAWQDPRLFQRNRQFQNAGGPIPFLIRARGTEAALFIRSGDKPVAKARDLKNQGTFLIIDFRNTGAHTCRIGDLRLRTIPIGTALDAPAELPEVKESKK